MAGRGVKQYMAKTNFEETAIKLTKCGFQNVLLIIPPGEDPIFVGEDRITKWARDHLLEAGLIDFSRHCQL